MDKFGFKLVFIAIFIIWFSQCAVYEARNSDDVDFFLEHNPEENGALLFFDPVQEQTDDNARENSDQVLSIFKNIGEEGRSNDAWVNRLNDKVHLMKVDKTSIDNARIVKEYKVGRTPLVVLLDNGKIILEEVIDIDTYDHIKEVYEAFIADSDRQKQSTTESGGWSSTDDADEYQPDSQTQPTTNDRYSSGKDDNSEAIEAAKKAQEAAEAAKKAADEASQALKDLKQSFDQQQR